MAVGLPTLGHGRMVARGRTSAGARLDAMNARASPPHPPGTLAVSQALQAHVTLSALLASRRLAERCMEVARPVLGAGLSAQLRPGPCEGDTWVLLAANGQAAAKARHLLPRVSQSLQAAGVAISEVRVRVSPVSVPGG